MHEQYTNREEIEGSSERSFGIVFGVVFSIIGLWPLLFGGGVRLWSLVVAGIFVGLAFIYPQSLATLNRLWFRFGLALAKITNPIIMGLLYVLIFVPVGLRDAHFRTRRSEFAVEPRGENLLDRSRSTGAGTRRYAEPVLR